MRHLTRHIGDMPVPIEFLRGVLGILCIFFAHTLGRAAAAVRAAVDAGARADQLHVAIAPSIGPCCYEIDEPVLQAFGRAYGRRAQAWLEPARDAHAMLDLWTANEALLADARPMETWPTLAETDAAGMCYTSGTTGHPKGAVYTHRAIFLHSMASSMTDLLGINERDVILHIVPMFHANAWCVPFAGVLNGATQIFGGPNPQPRDIVEIVHNERVTFVGAVPTVWIAIDAILEAEPRWDISSIRCIPIGGSAAPRTLIEKFDKKYGAPMLHAWGMTEMSPLGTVCRLKSYMDALPDEERYTIRAKQGYVAGGVDMRIVDDAGVEQPWNGKSVGEIQVRGPWVIRSYYDNPESVDRFTADGWFRTGDVASIDPEGYVQITDRTKDLIKSGGEWISSIDVETMIMDHPKVLEAAVIAVPHPKWVERPLACVVPKPGMTLEPREIVEYLRPRLAKFALPDEVVLIEAVPKTSVGKFDKKVLRERFKAWTPKD